MSNDVWANCSSVAALIVINGVLWSRVLHKVVELL